MKRKGIILGSFALSLLGSFLSLCSIFSLPHFLNLPEFLVNEGLNAKATATNVNVAKTRGKRSKNETLVIIIGSLRGGEQAWQSLYQNVLDVNQADLALAVGYKPEHRKNSSLYQRAKYLWEFPEFEDWTNALDLIANNDTSWHLLLKCHKMDGWICGDPGALFGGCGNRHGSGAIIFWIRWFVANHIQQLGLTEKYDRFVVTRADHYYLCQHDLSRLDAKSVWIPEGQGWGGYTDRHVVASADRILDVLNILPPVLKHPRRYLWKLKTGFVIGPERLIKYRWTEEGIQPRKFARMMFTSAVPGDQSRWGKVSKSTVKEGVYLKYKEEYPESYCTCFSQKCNEVVPEVSLFESLKAEIKGEVKKFFKNLFS